jgi:hypothetical protein
MDFIPILRSHLHTIETLSVSGLAIETRGFLKDWRINPIKGADQKYVLYLIK